MNKNGNTTSQNFEDVPKIVHRKIFIAVNSSIKKENKVLRSNITIHVKKLKKEQSLAKISRGKEIMKIRMKIKK